MDCLVKKQIKNPHGGTNPEYVLVPCGYCAPCKSNNRNQWSFRLKEEARASITQLFVTPTYDEENVPKNADSLSLNKPHVSEYIKAIRQVQDRTIKRYELDFPHKIRFYAVGEYGEQYQRPHYHILLFNVMPIISFQLEKIWKKGIVDVQQCNPAAIHYVTKYMMDKDNYPEDGQPPFTTMSQGIGKQYLDRARKFHQQNLQGFTTTDGNKQGLHQYYKNKLYTEEQKKKSLNKLMNTLTL